MKIKSKNKKKLIISLLLLLVAVILVSMVALLMSKSSDSGVAFDVDSDGRGVNYSKTQAEKSSESDLSEDSDRKLERVNTDTPQAPTANEEVSQRVVEVMMTSVGQSPDYTTIDASGFIVNAVEDDGLCTYVFSNGDRTITKESGVLQNPTSTACKSIKFPSTDLGTGEWDVSIKYSSNQSTGESLPMRLIVE